MNDLINSPSHYKGNKYEVIEVIASLGLSENYAFGNAIKYVLRYHKKNGRQDIEKCLWYVRYLRSIKLSNYTTTSSVNADFVTDFELPHAFTHAAAKSILAAARFRSSPAFLEQAEELLTAWLTRYPNYTPGA